MMGFQPVVLWTDLLLFGLLGCIVLAAWSARRSEPMRAAWGRVGASGVGMTSLTLLLIFVLVGLVDSLHYRERLAPAGAEAAGTKPQLSTDVRSALDALAEPLRTRVEKTYSAPLAWQLFARQTVEGKAGSQHREFPRLKYGGAGLQYPEQDLAGDVMGRIAIGLAAAAGVWLVLAGAVVGLVARSRRVPFGAGWRAVWRGKGGLAWRAMLLTLAGVLLLVGPITALAFRATIDRPERFRRSRDVGAHLGLTPARYQSGETDIQGKVSRCGDELARTALYEAAHSLLVRSRKWSSLRAWGMQVAKHRGLAMGIRQTAQPLGVGLGALVMPLTARVESGQSSPACSTGGCCGGGWRG